MIDSFGERLMRANPVPAAALGELRVDARKLIAGITATPARPERPRSRRLVPVLVIALAIAAPVALAAERSHLLDFAIGDPAPKTVKTQLDRMLEPAYGPSQGPKQGLTQNDVVRGTERLVGRLITSTGAVARLYAVDIRGGGACWVATGRPFGGGGCGGKSIHRASTIGGSVGMLFAGLGKRAPRTFGQGVTLYGPVGARGAATMRVHYKDGSADSVPVRRGWVMYEVPVANTHWGHEPVRIDVLSRSGALLASKQDPFNLHPPKLPTPGRVLEPHVLLARLPLGFRGGSIELRLAKSSTGNSCIQTLNTIDLIQTRNWLCDAAVGRDSFLGVPPPGAVREPVFADFRRFTNRGLAGGYVYVSGWAGAPVKSLELRFQDSTVRRLPLERRYFAYVVPPSRWVPGKRPSYLIGRDAKGEVVYRRFLYPLARCDYPVRDPRCSQMIVHNG
jgi:hypothetical protein